jgi:hypothetical protein
MVRAKWAAHRAAASVTGGDGASWLDGDAARAVSCVASVIPIVTGEVDPSVLDDLVSLCVTLAGHHGCAGCGQPEEPAQAGDPPGGDGARHAGPRPLSRQVRDMLERAIRKNHNSFNALAVNA